MSEEFDVDGLLNDLRDLIHKALREMDATDYNDPMKKYYYGISSTAGTVYGFVCRHRKAKEWKTGSLFDHLEKKPEPKIIDCRTGNSDQ